MAALAVDLQLLPPVVSAEVAVLAALPAALKLHYLALEREAARGAAAADARAGAGAGLAAVLEAVGCRLWSALCTAILFSAITAPTWAAETAAAVVVVVVMQAAMQD